MVKMKRIKHNDLTHYFLRPHQELPQAYIASCEEFFKSLKCRQAPASCHPDGWPAGNKQQASSGKPQASSMEELDPTIDWNKFTKELTNK